LLYRLLTTAALLTAAPTLAAPPASDDEGLADRLRSQQKKLRTLAEAVSELRSAS